MPVCLLVCACVCVYVLVCAISTQNKNYSTQQINSFCVCVHANGRIFTHVCLFACTYAYACVFACVCTYAYAYVFACVRVFVRAMCLCVLYALKKNYSKQRINSFCVFVHANGRICMYVYLLACLHVYACMLEMCGAFKNFASTCPLSC